MNVREGRDVREDVYGCDEEAGCDACMYDGSGSVRFRNSRCARRTARTEERGGDNGVGELLGVRQDVSDEDPHRRAARAFRARQGVHDEATGVEYQSLWNLEEASGQYIRTGSSAIRVDGGRSALWVTWWNANATVQQTDRQTERQICHARDQAALADTEGQQRGGAHAMEETHVH